MSHTSSEVSVFKPTNELRQVFGDPALVGPEKLEDYERLLASICSAIKPTDIIGWLLTKDITDWSWEIRRERTVKAEIIQTLPEGSSRGASQVHARFLEPV